MIQTSVHPQLAFVLDVLDKLIKLAAVLIGAFWTWWNYRKSRTYEQKLELKVTSTVFIKTHLYGDVRLIVKNISATKHTVQQNGTFCELLIVREDLSEESAALFRVFANRRSIEPDETIDDTFCWCVTQSLNRILWVKLKLRIVTDGVEWWTTRLIRVEGEHADIPNEVIQ
jgi:hypothetical protein